MEAGGADERYSKPRLPRRQHGQAVGDRRVRRHEEPLHRRNVQPGNGRVDVRIVDGVPRGRRRGRGRPPRRAETPSQHVIRSTISMSTLNISYVSAVFNIIFTRFRGDQLETGYITSTDSKMMGRSRG